MTELLLKTTDNSFSGFPLISLIGLFYCLPAEAVLEHCVRRWRS